MHRHRSSTIRPIQGTVLAADKTGSHWKSDMCITLHKHRPKKNNDLDSCYKRSEEYYKNYDHDDVPVKDDSSSYYNFKYKVSNHGDLEVNSAPTLDLDQLENKIYSNISQELQTDSSYAVSLESNIKLFRSTVEEIFDTFHHAMTDFELYKKRFEEILSKNKEQSIAEMEDFIKDMFQNIVSSDSALSQYTSNSTQQSVDKDSNMAVIEASTESGRSADERSFEMPKITVETFKNDNYTTDSAGDNSSNDKSTAGTFCINFLNSNRSVQIRLNNRDMVSEINIREKERQVAESSSAGNIKRLNTIKIEASNTKQHEEEQAPEKYIPIKISNPKKNIHLDQDFTHDVEKTGTNCTFFYKICNFLCRRLRKV